MNLNSIFKEFYNNIEKRLQKHNVECISEDCIRYDFYSAINKKLPTENIILEYPHDQLDKKEVDMVAEIEVNEFMACELKYFRRIPSGKNIDRTGAIANFVSDFIKLNKLKRKIQNKLAICLSDDEMIKYMQNPDNGFDNILNSKTGNEFIIENFNKRAKHFKDIIESKTGIKIPTSNEHKIKVTKLFDMEIGNDHRLIILQIIG